MTLARTVSYLVLTVAMLMVAARVLSLVVRPLADNMFPMNNTEGEFAVQSWARVPLHL